MTKAERSSTLPTTTMALAAAALTLLGVACSRKPQDISVTASTTNGASGASGANDWAWASSQASGPAAASYGTAPSDAPATRPVTTPPAPAPRNSPPRSTAPRDEPVDRLSHPSDRASSAPAPKPAPVRYTAPAGTSASVRLDSSLSSESANVGQSVSATLASDLSDGAGHVVLPAGTKLSGSVTEAVSAKKVKKKSSLAIQLTRATLPDGTSVAISAGKHLEGKGYTKKDGAIIGGSAAGGALLGQILGHDTKSTAEGAIVGGAIASGVVMSHKGEDVELPAGTEMQLTMDIPVSVER